MDFTLMGLHRVLSPDELNGLQDLLNSESYAWALQPKHQEAQSRRRITFGVADQDAIPGDFGSPESPWPYVNMSDPTHCLVNMVHAEEIVITESSIGIVVEFPIRVPQLFEIKSEKGFTRARLAKEISMIYQHIYNEEDRTSEEMAHFLPSLARSRTNGKYGIYGHWLPDLDLKEVWQSAHAQPGSYWYLEMLS